MCNTFYPVVIKLRMHQMMIWNVVSSHFWPQLSKTTNLRNLVLLVRKLPYFTGTTSVTRVRFDHSFARFIDEHNTSKLYCRWYCWLFNMLYDNCELFDIYWYEFEGYRHGNDHSWKSWTDTVKILCCRTRVRQMIRIRKTREILNSIQVVFTWYILCMFYSANLKHCYFLVKCVMDKCTNFDHLYGSYGNFTNCQQFWYLLSSLNLV